LQLFQISKVAQADADQAKTLRRSDIDAVSQGESNRGEHILKVMNRCWKT
jgi:hypothetical protein